MGLIKWAVMLLSFTVTYTYIPRLFAPKLQPIIEGYFHPKFRAVAEAYRKNVESGKEKGSAFTVYHRGNKLIDMWCGYADRDLKRPWNDDIMTVLYSSTKGVAAILIGKMVDNGWLDYDKPVATYWPEFAQNGKGKITVAQLLAHQAGVISLGKKIHVNDIRDKREEYLRLLEQVHPAWVPGTAHGYHGLTFGMYVDTLAQKADPKHRNITQIFREEIGVPFDVDIHIGLPKSQFYRMARGYDMSAFERLYHSIGNWPMFRVVLEMMFNPDSNVGKALTVLDFDDSSLNTPEALSIGLTSFLGVGSAQSLAKLYSYLSMGGTLKGKQLLSAKTVKRLTTPVKKAHDQVLCNLTMTFGPGTGFKENIYEPFKGQMLAGHPGFGGQVGFVDPANQLAVGYVTNFRQGLGMWDDSRYLDLEKSLYESFASYIKNQK